MVIDLKPVLGQPYKTWTQTVTNTVTLDTVTTSHETMNLEFVANGVVFMFVLIICGNILLRTIFPKR